MKALAFLAIFVILVSGCVSQQEIKLGMQCETEGINGICAAACMGNYSAELDAWRCSAAGQPVCICKAYQQPPF